MKRSLIIAIVFLALSVAPAADAAYYCDTIYYAYWVSVVWSDGTVTGHWQYDQYQVCYWVQDYYSPYTLVSSGGGGNRVPAAVQSLQQEYSDQGCDVPGASEFDNQSLYDLHPSSSYSFANLKSPFSDWAIIKPELKQGLDAMVSFMDNQPPTITSAYRTPDENSSTAGSAACSAHTRGTAADISIRDESGNFSCNSWNLMAAAAHAANAWIEPWSATVQAGTPHLHVDFGRAPNDDYGTCSGYP